MEWWQLPGASRKNKDITPGFLSADELSREARKKQGPNTALWLGVKCDDNEDKEDRSQDSDDSGYVQLSADDIEKQLKEQGASIELRLGDEYYVTSGTEPKWMSERRPIVTIPHGQFALLKTKEKVRLGNAAFGLITMKFTLKKRGLINVSGFHVDPGFHGHIVYSVFNAGPTDIQLRRGDPAFMLFVYHLGEPPKEDFLRPNGEVENERLDIGLVSQLRGSSVSLSKLQSDVRELGVKYNVMVGFIGALVIAVVGLLVGILLRGQP